MQSDTLSLRRFGIHLFHCEQQGDFLDVGALVLTDGYQHGIVELYNYRTNQLWGRCEIDEKPPGLYTNERIRVIDNTPSPAVN